PRSYPLTHSRTAIPGAYRCLPTPWSRGGAVSTRQASPRTSRPLSVNMGETVTPWEFSVEGESGSESDERIGAGPRWPGDRGGGQSDAAAVLGGVQTEDRPGGRRLQDAGRDRGVVAAGGGVLLAPH